MHTDTKILTPNSHTDFKIVRDLISGVMASLVVGLVGSILLVGLVMLFSSNA